MMPLHGYTRMFERMLAHSNILLLLSVDYRDVQGSLPFADVVYTGPIDEYFDYCFGKLPYRSLRFDATGACSTAGGGDQFPERKRLHARHRVQVIYRSEPSQHGAGLRGPAGGGGSRLSEYRVRKTMRCTAN